MANSKTPGHIIFRLDAGRKFGLGHLSRCLSLADSLLEDHWVHFIIKTDDKPKVMDFIKLNYNSIQFIDIIMPVANELELILKTVKDVNGFLIIDHYAADVDYQLFLRSHNIRWLQFDSHAKQKLYADIVLHGSPGATRKMYAPLVDFENTRVLLGTQYSIVNKNFLSCRNRVKPRERIRKIIICFGGGNDKGASLKCFDQIDKKLFKKIEIVLIISDKNPDLEELSFFAENYSNLHIVINSHDIHNLMADADLAIISPGTLSYEAASVGLPMLLIATADNQNINVKGWTQKEAAISLGLIEDLSSDSLNSTLLFLTSNPQHLKKMSVNSMKSVDGLAVSRIRDEILSVL